MPSASTTTAVGGAKMRHLLGRRRATRGLTAKRALSPELVGLLLETLSLEKVEVTLLDVRRAVRGKVTRVQLSLVRLGCAVRMKTNEHRSAIVLAPLGEA